ncbi:hypothetical protein [Fodinibius salsisoli]|uniref:Hook-length control protein FliK n=1 Tax=Fodinibius salsisoli TaxID=2820877 RepID=A0ABT3PHH8_9BACT|nr:hypothetical protein [Fodinibius salsisoli]MCW9705374.1 hypothetical protein [Fodinibius salsisoli]
MLSKLLSNIRSGSSASVEDTGNGSGNKDGISSSEHDFKSLLYSLKSEGVSNKAKQHLLTLAGESSKQKEAAGDKATHNILGGSFIATSGNDDKNLLKAKKGILKELKKEFQNTKSELTGGKSTESLNSDPKVNTEQLIEEVSAKSAEGNKETVSDKNVDAESDDTQLNGESKVEGEKQKESNSAETQAVQKIADKVSITPQDKRQKNGESQKGDSEKVSARNNKGDRTQKKHRLKQNAEKLVDVQNNKAVADQKNIDEEVNKAAKNVDETSGKNQIRNNKIDGQKVSATNIQNELPNERNNIASTSTSNKQKKSVLRNPESSNETKGGAGGKKGAGQSDSVIKPKNENVPLQKAPEIKENASVSQGSDKQSPLSNREGLSFEKRQNNGSRQVLRDSMKQHDKVRKRPDNPKVSSGNNQVSEPLQAGQSAKTESTEQQKNMMNSFFQKKGTTNISMKAVQNQKVKKSSNEKTETENSLRGFGKQSLEDRNKFLSRLGITGSNAQKQAKPLKLQNFTGVSVGDSNGSLSEQKINWEEQMTKAMDSSCNKESNASSSASSMRLGQMPVTNVSLRKKIMPGLTQRVQKAASSAKENAGNWQKHTFTLDDGKNIQLSVRESKGVVQIKMGSMNLDLSKFLQQNLQQIREHLRQEFDSEIDLQFENQQQGEESELSENTDRSNQKRNYRNNFAGESLAAEHAEEVRTKTVRNFGYNQMEWTA